MRQLVLLRGGMGSGKSTWIKEHNLEDFTLSPDALRVKTGAFSKRDIHGNLGANVRKDGYVWQIIMSLLEQRMASGMFTIVDATHGTEKAINAYRSLANKYRYRVYVIDFKVPLSVLIGRVRARNSNANGLTDCKYIPDWAVESKYKQLEWHKIPSWVTKLTPENAIANIAWRYENDDDKDIYVFGDIHSSYLVLKKAWEDLDLDNKPDSKIILVGDYFDRGLRPVETFKFLADKIKKPNVTMLMGNHDFNLFNIVNQTINKAPRHTRVDTYYPLLRAGVSVKDIKNFVNNLQQGVFINKNGYKYWITHGGILPVNEEDPLAINKISMGEMIYGTGDFSDPIDIDFPEKLNIISVHGHRNMNHDFNIFFDDKESRIKAVNLEQGVDEGLNLAILKISNRQLTSYTYHNFEFNFSNSDEKWRKEKLLSNLMSNPVQYTKQAMHSKYIKAARYGDIVALNFTRDAFIKGVWNDFTTRSRGLFIDMKNNKVFARGYDKFFRVDELGGWSKLEFKGTVHAYKKYNGLLGLLTSDGKKLVYMSKGTVYTPNSEGKYAKLVKDVISKQLEDKPDAIDFLIKFLEDKTMLFEVVDEEKDPHIVHNFDKPTAVMLDIVYNSLVFKKLGYKALVSVANKVQLPVKEQLGSFSSDVRKNVEAIVKDKELEGVVLEDSTGFMTKAKTFLYTAIKARRSSWDYEIKNDRVSLNEFSKRLAHISGRDYSETVGQDAYTKGNIKKFDNVLKKEIVKPNPEKNLLNIRKENGLLI